MVTSGQGQQDEYDDGNGAGMQSQPAQGSITRQQDENDDRNGAGVQSQPAQRRITRQQDENDHGNGAWMQLSQLSIRYMYPGPQQQEQTKNINTHSN